MDSVVSDIDLYCLVTEYSIKIWKKCKILLKTPKIGNGPHPTDKGPVDKSRQVYLA